MTAPEHLRRIRRLERWGESITALCVVPLLLTFLFARQQDFAASLQAFAAFLVLYALDRFLLYRARSHLECVGEQFKELYPR